MVLALGVSILLARHLGPAMYGKYSLAIAIITVCAIPSFAGWPSLIVREVSRCVAARDTSSILDLIGFSTKWSVLISLLIGVVCTVSVISLDESVLDPGLKTMILLGLPILILSGVLKINVSALRGLKKPISAQLPIMVVQPITHFSLLLLFLVVLNLGPLGAMLSVVISQIFATVIIFASWKAAAKGWEKSANAHDYKRWTGQLPSFAAISMVTLLGAQVSILLLGAFSDTESIAEFRVASRAAQFVTIPLLIVNLVVAPLFAEAHKRNDLSSLQNHSDRALQWSSILAIPVVVIMVGFGNSLLELLYGPEYSAAYFPLVILVGGHLFNVLVGSVAMLLNMSGFEKTVLVGQSIGLSTNVVFALILIPVFGAVGAAVALALSIVVWNSFLFFKVRRHLGLRVGPSRLMVSPS